MMYQETKYSPQSTKAESIAARGELPDRNILRNVRIMLSPAPLKIELYGGGPGRTSAESVVSDFNTQGIGVGA